MKIVGFERDGQLMIGVSAADGSVEPLAPMDVFWRAPDALLRAARPNAPPIAATQLRLRPAVPPAARVICIGLNYRKHAVETNTPIPSVPVVFGRWTRSLSVDGDPAPAIEPKFDWEGELGVIIGRRMFQVDAERGLAGVFGYCAFNDLSARTFQLQTSQWTLGKNSDASGPMSAIVTADEVGNPANGLRLVTRVNGEVRQDSTTADMIFSIGEIVAHLSQVMTLEPGDLIATGTPSGVGLASQTFLKAGDVVEVEIEKVGRVRTPIVAVAS